MQTGLDVECLISRGPAILLSPPLNCYACLKRIMLANWTIPLFIKASLYLSMMRELLMELGFTGLSWADVGLNSYSECFEVTKYIMP